MNTHEPLPEPAPDHANPVPNPPSASGTGTTDLVAPEPPAEADHPAPDTSSSRHRNGKVARLPKETRSRINQMLDDGLPFHQIIENLGESGVGLSVGYIGTWKKGGYQDYLREQQLLEEFRISQEFITDLVREDSSIDAFQAAHKVAASLICRAIAEFGSHTFHDAVKANPLNLLRMLNALSRITAGGLKCQRFLADEAERLAKSTAEPQTGSPRSVGLTEPAVAELNHRLNLM